MNKKGRLCLFIKGAGQRAKNCDSCDLARVSAYLCTSRASTSAKLGLQNLEWYFSPKTGACFLSGAILVDNENISYS